MGAMKTNALTPIHVKTKKKQFTYNEFAADYEGKTGEHVLQGKTLENCDCTDGKLQLMNTFDPCRLSNTGFVVELPNLSEQPNAIYELIRRKSSTGQRVICCTQSNGDLYVISGSHTSNGKLYNVGKNSKGIFAYDEQNKQVLLFVGEAGVFMYSIDAGQWCTQKALLPMGCYVKGRLFCATHQGQLVYFAPFAPREYQDTMEDGGEVQLPQEAGNIVDIAGVGDCVYVFCEYGIVYLKATASARDFHLQIVPYSGGKIFKGSACATMQNGGEVFFMTSDGLCTVKEKQVTHFGMIGKMVVQLNGASCQSWLVDNKYIVKLNDMFERAHAYAIDLKSKQAYPFTMYPCMTSGGGKTLIAVDESVAYLRIHKGTNQIHYMRFETSLSFGTNKKKLLKSLLFSGYDSCYGYVESEYGRINYYAKCGECIDINLKGTIFKLSIQNSKENCLTGMTADVVTLQ